MFARLNTADQNRRFCHEVETARTKSKMLFADIRTAR